MAGRLEIHFEWVPSLFNWSDKNRRGFKGFRKIYDPLVKDCCSYDSYYGTCESLMRMISNLWKLSSIWGWRSRCDWKEKRAKLENAESAKCRLDSTHVIFTTTSTDWTKNISFDGTFLSHSEMFHSRIWLWGRSGHFFDLRLCVNQVIFFAAYRAR